MLEVSSCLWVPVKDFSQDLRKFLTVNVFSLDGTKQIVECFRTDRRGYVGIPRVYGLKSFAKSKVTDLRSSGSKVVFPRKVTLRDYQEPFVDAILYAAETNTDFIAKAGTGKGKTVCGLSVVQTLGRSAAIVVDQENLQDQWVERCVQHLGLDVSDIGIVRGPKATYKDKPITICMMQTLTRRELPEDFYSAFGTVIFDECHTAGAPTYSAAMMMFDARVRFGLSATPERNDALRKAISWNLGGIEAELTDEHAASSVYVVESEGVYSWRVNNSKMTGGFIGEIVDDGRRNLDIAYATKWLFESGRDTLVVSDRVEHLSTLQALCRDVGIPKEVMGIYAKSKVVCAYTKDPRPPRRPIGWEKDTEYTPVHLALVQKTLPKKDRDRVKDTANVIFATYGIIAKGVDIPRLSAGVDATPRSSATQVYGRILRTQPGKLRPIWVTFSDINSFRSLYQLSERLVDYGNSNAEVFLWDFLKGRKRLDLVMYRRELKDRILLLRQSQIITSLDGNNTLMIPSTLIDSDD